MMPGTLARYFGLRFFNVVAGTFGSLFVLVLMADFVELMRRTSDLKDVSALTLAQISIYRVPHITERIIPFAVLVGAMACYLNLSRRLARLLVNDEERVHNAAPVVGGLDIVYDLDHQHAVLGRVGGNAHG